MKGVSERPKATPPSEAPTPDAVAAGGKGRRRSILKTGSEFVKDLAARASKGQQFDEEEGSTKQLVISASSDGGPSNGKGKKKGKSSKQKPEAVLESAAALHERTKVILAEAEEFDAKADGASQSSLPRKLGNALSKRIGSGSKDAVRKLLREFDQNGDGVLQKIEVRLMVRNHLKIVADNKEIDAFFASVDVDNSGEIDQAEFVGACHKLKEAAEDAREESEVSRDHAARLRDRAALCESAAEAMQRLEEEEARVDSLFQGAQTPIELRVGSAISRRGIKPSELVARWDAGKGSVGRGGWAGLVGELELAAGDEAVGLFEQYAKAKGVAELEARYLSKVLMDLSNRVANEQKEQAATLKPLREAGRRLQERLSQDERESFVRHQQSFRSKEEQAAADDEAAQAARTAKEKKKAATKEKRLEEKKQFEAKVQERRSGSARKEWQRVGLVVSAASEIGVRARRMSVGVGTGLANLRNSFSTSTTEDTDRDCTVDNEEECELVA